MADAHYQIGVVHGLADAPLYRWQDAAHQERYDAGYAVGQFQRLTADYDNRYGKKLGMPEAWDVFEQLMKRRGLIRTR